MVTSLLLCACSHGHYSLLLFACSHGHLHFALCMQPWSLAFCSLHAAMVTSLLLFACRMQMQLTTIAFCYLYSIQMQLATAFCSLPAAGHKPFALCMQLATSLLLFACRMQMQLDTIYSLLLFVFRCSWPPAFCSLPAAGHKPFALCMHATGH